GGRLRDRCDRRLPHGLHRRPAIAALSGCQPHRLDPAKGIYVGGAPVDPGYARKLGFRCYAPADLLSI
ncbi:MAG: hypothetical protein ACKOEC_22360, partial [Acidimicrobiia bacterium]